MKRLSSKSTTFYKKASPAIAFGFCGLLVILGGAHAFTHRDPTILVFLLAVSVLAAFQYFVMKKYIWDLADEVYDAGEFLVVRNRHREYQVPLTDIMNVSSSMSARPPRITLTLTGATSTGPLGTEVVFCPETPFIFNPFAKSKLAEDLILRVDRARSKRAG